MSWRSCLRSLAGSFSTCLNPRQRRVSWGFLVRERTGLTPRSWSVVTPRTRARSGRTLAGS